MKQSDTTDVESLPTLIHERVDQARQGVNPTVVCRMPSGWWVLGDDQRLPGYSLLLSDPTVEHLDVLDAEQKSAFLGDMAAIGGALMRVLKPSIINYSILGNTDRALHAHIHPRYDHEPPDCRRTHAIIYHWTKQTIVPFDAVRDGDLIARLREAVGDGPGGGLR